MKSSLTGALALVCLSLVATPNAFAGKETGGGDEYSIHFLEVANQVTAWVKANGSSLPQPINFLDFETAVKSTKVESTDQPLVLDGATKDAVNIPEDKKIILQRGAWDRMTSSLRKQALVFHEYLGILRIPDLNYQVSNQILKTVAVSEQRAACQAIFEFLDVKLNQTNMTTCLDGYFGRLMENSADAENPKILYFGAPRKKARWQTCLVDMKSDLKPTAEVINCSSASSSEE